MVMNKKQRAGERLQPPQGSGILRIAWVFILMAALLIPVTASTLAAAPAAPPVAVPDSYETYVDRQIFVAAPGVLANDSDPDGDPLSSFLVDSPANGTLSLGTDGSFTYEPTLGFTGVDTFTYHNSDGMDPSNIAQVTITVIDGTNQPPVAVPDSYLVEMDTVLNVPAPGVLVNDSDPDGSSLVSWLVNTPANGALTLNTDGSFIYVPNLGFTGMDSFTYHNSDGIDPSNVVEVTLTVAADPYPFSIYLPVSRK